MFNIGISELIILGIIGLLVIGPEQLPDLARKAARLINDLKRVGEEIMSPVKNFQSEAEKLLEKTRHEVVAEALNMKNKAEQEKAAAKVETSHNVDEAKKTNEPT